METPAEYDTGQGPVPNWLCRYVGGKRLALIYANQAPGAAILFVQQEWGSNEEPGGETVQVSRDGETWTTYRVEMELRPIYSAKVVEADAGPGASVRVFCLTQPGGSGIMDLSNE